MTASRTNKKKYRRRYLCLGMGAILLAMVLTGCGGTYGSFKYDEEVDTLFENLKVLPDHHYYFSGPESYPRAIIAIHKRYTLVSNLWKPVEMSEEKLKRWVRDPSRRGLYYPYTFGRYLLDADGGQMGLWYSLRDWRDFMTVKMLDGTRVQVSTPIDEGYRRRSPKFFFSVHDD